MSSSMLLGVFDWIAEFFQAMIDFIPKLMYLLYASLACVLDILQLFFRKLAGLDHYFINGEPVTGDLVTNFIAGIFGINFSGNDTIDYSPLATVFWAFVIFGVVVCFTCTVIAIVKSHYNYNEKAAKGPMQYVYTAIKSLINMVAVPLIVTIGLFLSQAVLTAVDSITSTSSSDIDNIFGQTSADGEGDQAMTSVASTLLYSVETARGDKTYIFYDVFGFGCEIVYGKKYPDDSAVAINGQKVGLTASTNQTFSGALFKVAAFNGNRARRGEIGVKQNNISGTDDTKALFYQATTQDELANMIDTAFACSLHLQKPMQLGYAKTGAKQWTSTKYFTAFLSQKINAFSKFNIGAVWYYYDLWNFNFIVGFGAIVVCLTIFLNIIMSLMARIFMCVGLFLVAPPLFGLEPLDDGKAKKGWVDNFVKQALIAYGAVLGMNIMFLILPFIYKIQFFNIAVADYLAQTIVIIVGLITIKALMKTFSGLVGSEDANSAGEGIKGDTLKTLNKAGSMTIGAAKMPFTFGKGVAKGALAIKNKGQAMVQTHKAKVEAKEAKRYGKIAEKARKKADNMNKADKVDKFLTGKSSMALKNGEDRKTQRNEFIDDALAAGMDKKQAKTAWKQYEEQKTLDLVKGQSLDLIGGESFAASVDRRTRKMHYMAGGAGLGMTEKQAEKAIKLQTKEAARQKATGASSFDSGSLKEAYGYSGVDKNYKKQTDNGTKGINKSKMQTQYKIASVHGSTANAHADLAERYAKSGAEHNQRYKQYKGEAISGVFAPANFVAAPVASELKPKKDKQDTTNDLLSQVVKNTKK